MGKFRRFEISEERDESRETPQLNSIVGQAHCNPNAASSQQLKVADRSTRPMGKFRLFEISEENSLRGLSNIMVCFLKCKVYREFGRAMTFRVESLRDRIPLVWTL